MRRENIQRNILFLRRQRLPEPDSRSQRPAPFAAAHENIQRRNQTGHYFPAFSSSDARGRYQYARSKDQEFGRGAD